MGTYRSESVACESLYRSDVKSRVRVISVAYSPNGGIAQVQSSLAKAMSRLGVQYSLKDLRRSQHLELGVPPRQSSHHVTSLIETLLGLVTSVEPDTRAATVVHCHDYRVGIAARKLADALSVPLVHTLHYWFDRANLTARSRNTEGWGIEIRERLQDHVVRSADIVTAVSDFTAASAAPLNGNIVVIKNAGPKLPKPADSLEEPFLLLASRLTRGKGADAAIKAMVELTGKELIVAGDGSQREGLRDLAFRQGVGHQVRFIGKQRQAVVLDLMRRATCVVIPSRWDWYPLSVLEAQAAGALVVARNAGGIPEQISHGEDGLLFDHDEDLADQLRAVIGQDQIATRRRIRSKAIGTASARPAWSDVAKQYLALFEGLAP